MTDTIFTLGLIHAVYLHGEQWQLTKLRHKMEKLREAAAAARGQPWPRLWLHSTADHQRDRELDELMMRLQDDLVWMNLKGEEEY
jgi:hypothetical protein